MSLPAWPAALATHARRMQLNIVAHDAVTAPLPFWIQLDIMEMVAQAIVRADCGDLVVWDHTAGAEIGRVVNAKSLTPKSTGVGFALPRNIAAGGSETGIWIYYGDANYATATETNPFLLFDNFATDLGNWIANTGSWSRDASNNVMLKAASGVGEVEAACDQTPLDSGQRLVFRGWMKHASGSTGLNIMGDGANPFFYGHYALMAAGGNISLWAQKGSFTYQSEYNYGRAGEWAEFVYTGTWESNNAYTQCSTRGGGHDGTVSGVRDGLSYYRTHINIEGPTNVAAAYDCIRAYFVPNAMRREPVGHFGVIDTQVPPDVTPPGPVTGLSAAVINRYLDGNNQRALIWVTWTWPEDTDGDLNEAAIFFGDNEYARVEYGVGTGLEIDLACQAEAYEITVVAYDDSGNASTPTTTQVTAAATPAPAAPTGLTLENHYAEAGAPNDSLAHVQVGWTYGSGSPTGAVVYRYVTSAGPGGAVEIGRVDRPGIGPGVFQDCTATPGTSYTYYVKAQGSLNTLSDASAAAAIVAATERTGAQNPLDPPEGLAAAITAGNDYADLTWSDPSPTPEGIERIEIQREDRDVLPGTYATVAYIAAGVEAYTDGSLADGRYRWRVRTIDTNGSESAWSSVVLGTIETQGQDPPPAPTGGEVIDWSAT